MSLFEQISKDIMAAMKAKDKVRLEALRNVKKYFIEAKTAPGNNDELSDAEALKILAKLAKQSHESAALFQEKGRSELAEEELAVWQGTASLPTVTQETWAKETEKIQAVQQLQIREVLARRIVREAETLLRDDFPGITEKDIEVYIQQESPESGASQPCIVTVHTEETDRAEDIRQQLQSGLRLPQSQIRIKGKESTDG